MLIEIKCPLLLLNEINFERMHSCSSKPNIAGVKECVLHFVLCWGPFVPFLGTARILAAHPHPTHLLYHISTLIITPLPITHVMGQGQGQGKESLTPCTDAKGTIMILFIPKNLHTFLKNQHVVNQQSVFFNDLLKTSLLLSGCTTLALCLEVCVLEATSQILHFAQVSHSGKTLPPGTNHC